MLIMISPCGPGDASGGIGGNLGFGGKFYKETLSPAYCCHGAVLDIAS